MNKVVGSINLPVVTIHTCRARNVGFSATTTTTTTTTANDKTTILELHLHACAIVVLTTHAGACCNVVY